MRVSSVEDLVVYQKALAAADAVSALLKMGRRANPRDWAATSKKSNGR